MFTSIVELTVPHAASLNPRLPEKGSEGSPCITSFEGKLSGRLKFIKRLGSPPRDKNKNSDAYAGYADLIANIGPKPHTDMSGRSFPSLISPR